MSFGGRGGRKSQSSPVRAWAPGPLPPAAPQVCQVRGVKHQSLEVGRDGAWRVTVPVQARGRLVTLFSVRGQGVRTCVLM